MVSDDEPEVEELDVQETLKERSRDIEPFFWPAEVINQKHKQKCQKCTYVLLELPLSLM
jgi:hypothetical protein